MWSNEVLCGNAPWRALENENTEEGRINPTKSLAAIGTPIGVENGMKSRVRQDGWESAPIAEESVN